MDPRTELILDVITHDVRRYVDKQKELIIALQEQLFRLPKDSVTEAARAFSQLVTGICTDHEKCIDIMRYRYMHNDNILFPEVKIVVLVLFGRQINRMLDSGKNLLRTMSEADLMFETVTFIVSVAQEFFSLTERYLQVGDQTSKSEPTNFYLSRLLAQVADRHAASFTPGNRTLEIESTAKIYARKDQIYYVFSELIKNAVTYESLDRPLHVLVYDDAESSTVSHRRIIVSDTGAGMFKTRDEIFGPTIQATESAPPANGAAARPRLGLKICDKLLTENSGRIDFTSDASGTRIFLDLPRSKNRSNGVDPQHGGAK